MVEICDRKIGRKINTMTIFATEKIGRKAAKQLSVQICDWFFGHKINTNKIYDWKIGRKVAKE